MEQEKNIEQPEKITENDPPSSANGASKRKLEHDSEEPQSDEEVDLGTMLDIMNEENEIQNDVMAVLGTSSDNECSYLLGYVARQPIYACNTCKMKTDPETGKNYLAGICLACSDHCHEGHELFELYTKRNFRCDCGNDKFENTKCKLFNKVGFNEQNKYDHNFQGLYCSCDRPYPDPEIDIHYKMIQCGICEDWYHNFHLKSDQPDCYDEMVCYRCVEKSRFLIYYIDDGCIKSISFETTNTNDTNSPIESVNNDNYVSPADHDFMMQAISDDQPSDGDCILSKLKQNYTQKYQTDVIDDSKCVTLYLELKWRTNLCKCSSCLQMYSDLNVPFLPQPQDMVQIYSYKAIEANQKAPNSFLSRFDKMSYYQKAEFLQGVNELKNELSAFFKTFEQNNQVIKKEDIDSFFKKMNDRKRQRVRIPYFCR